MTVLWLPHNISLCPLRFIIPGLFPIKDVHYLSIEDLLLNLDQCSIGLLRINK